MERPQPPPEPLPIRRGLFSTAPLPVPMATPVAAPVASPPRDPAPAPARAQEGRPHADSPALQTLLELQPSLDPSTRAGVANVLRQWGLQADGSTAFALVPMQTSAVRQQHVVPPVLDDLELFRQSLRTTLQLLGRVVGVPIDPADPNESLPLSVLAKQTGQNEMSMLLPLVREVHACTKRTPLCAVGASAVCAVDGGALAEAGGGGTDALGAAGARVAAGAAPAAGGVAAAPGGVAAAGAGGGNTREDVACWQQCWLARPFVNQLCV